MQRIIYFLKPIILVLFISTASLVSGQTESQADSPIELFIHIKFDTTSFYLSPEKTGQDIGILKIKYFSGSKGDTLATFIYEELRRMIVLKFDNMALDIRIHRELPDRSLYAANMYLLDINLFVDSEASLNMNLALQHLTSQTKIRTFERVLKKDLMKRYDWWNQLVNAQGNNGRVQQILHEVASSLVGVIVDKTVAWIVESSIRIRVAVNTFEQIGENENIKRLEKVLRMMVESELSRSEEIIVYEQVDSAAMQDKNKEKINPRVNYHIEGKFSDIGEEILIDIRCIKVESNRILVSSEIKLEQLNLEQLMLEITDVSHRLKRAMKADFKSTTKTVAIISSPPVQFSIFEKPAAIDFQIAGEINRNITQKLRQLTINMDKSKLRLDVNIYHDPEKVVEYLHKPADPSEILADLDVDYLILLNYENMRHSFRLTTNLHSFDIERPVFAKLVHVESTKKTRVNHAIDSTVVALLNEFCLMGFVKPPGICDSLASGKEIDIIRSKIQKIKVKDIRVIKGIGLRFGATDHADVHLFYEKNSSFYYEVFFSYIMPGWRFWRFDFGMEPSFGLDNIRMRGFFRGIVSANGFINLKLVYSDMQYSNLPFIVSVGGGFGGQGIRYSFSCGDSGYKGDRDFSDGIIKPAYNLFGEVEFIINEWWRFHSLLRRVFTSNKITAFENIRLEHTNTPVGVLGGYYFVLGLKYTWR